MNEQQLREIQEHDAAYAWVETDSPYLTLCAEERRFLLQHIRSMEAELREARRDAERYRYLRSPMSFREGENSDAPFIARFHGSFSKWTGCDADQVIDAALDAAMEKQHG